MLIVQGIYWYTHHKLQQLWNLYHFVPNTILYHILKVSGNLGSGTWFFRAVYNTAWKHFKKLMIFWIVGQRTYVIHLIVKQAYYLDCMQHSIQLEEIHCVSEKGFKQNFANSCCGRTENRIISKGSESLKGCISKSLCYRYTKFVPDLPQVVLYTNTVSLEFYILLCGNYGNQHNLK